MTQRVLEDLSEAECFECLKQETVGRFVFQEAEGPAAVPVNYGVAGTEIVFRIEQRSHIREVLTRPVAFEVDHAEAASGVGWSVLIRGAGHEIGMDRVPGLLRQMGEAFPRPWAEGVHNVWVSITPRKITGRRLTVPYVAAIR
ncbi:MAG TPA: pyridoxamine 5'-phosphate oxidase family protein [Myxococcota bacterium]|nr:pyridoxamine 5'-phosphate oxidase family protein [Myxococcota bacterium]